MFIRNVFCFNDFNQTVTALHYSAHIKPRKMIKTTKTENINHKHNMTLIVLSQKSCTNQLQFSGSKVGWKNTSGNENDENEWL